MVPRAGESAGASPDTDPDDFDALHDDGDVDTDRRRWCRGPSATAPAVTAPAAPDPPVRGRDGSDDGDGIGDGDGDGDDSDDGDNDGDSDRDGDGDVGRTTRPGGGAPAPPRVGTKLGRDNPVPAARCCSRRRCAAVGEATAARPALLLLFRASRGDHGRGVLWSLNRLPALLPPLALDSNPPPSSLLPTTLASRLTTLLPRLRLRLRLRLPRPSSRLDSSSTSASLRMGEDGLTLRRRFRLRGPALDGELGDAGAPARAEVWGTEVGAVAVTADTGGW